MFQYYLHKKNLFYISSYKFNSSPIPSPVCSAYITLSKTFYLLNSAHKRHRQYKHLLLNTVVVFLSGLVYIKSHRSSFCGSVLCNVPLAGTSSILPGVSSHGKVLTVLSQGISTSSILHLLSHFQLRVEFIHFILYFLSLPARLPHFPYFSLASFSPSETISLSRNLKNTNSLSSSSWLLAKSQNSISTRLDLQLPKLRKTSYRRTTFFNIPSSFLCFENSLPSVRYPGFLRRSFFNLSLFPNSSSPASSFCLLYPSFSGIRSAIFSSCNLNSEGSPTTVPEGCILGNPVDLSVLPFMKYNVPLDPSSLLANSTRSIFSHFPLFDPRIHHNLLSCWPSLSSPSLSVLVRFHSSKAHNASTFVSNLSRFSIAFLKKNRGKNKLQQLKNSVYSILRLLSCFPSSGVGFQYSGRIYGAKKASSFKMLIGSVPLNTLDAFIDYSHIMQKTRNGTWGFKVWLRNDLTPIASFDNSSLKFSFSRKGTLPNPNSAKWLQP